MEEGYSYGYNNARDAVSLTPRRQIEPLLLPDQFMNLPRLSGYLKFPDGFPAAPVSLEPRTWPRVAEGFIAREQSHSDPMPDLARFQRRADEGALATQTGTSEEHPASNDDGAGKPLVPRQLTLAYREAESEQPRERQPDGPADRVAPNAARPGSDLCESAAPAEVGTVWPETASLPLASVVKGESTGEQERDVDRAESGDRKPAGPPEGKQAAVHERPNRDPADRERRRQERDLLEGAAEPDRTPDFGEFEPDL
jgi:hypothetical protein